jgi:hypothetical protein
VNLRRYLLFSGKLWVICSLITNIKWNRIIVTTTETRKFFWFVTLLLNSSNSSANVCRNFKMCYFVINWTVCQCQQVRMLRFRSSTELSRLLSSCLSPICPLVRPASLHSLCLRTAAIYATTGNWSLYINVRSHNLGLKVKTDN